MSPRARLAARPSRSRAPKATVVKVHPLVWREALRLAGRDASRIEVVGPAEVVVRNPRE